MTEAATIAQTTQAAVIDFAQIGKSRPPRRGVKKRPNHPDADLIEHCIEYGMQIAAGKASYKVDPTDSEFASFCDDICQSRADRALRAVLEMSPSTLDGLRAKAELVEIATNDWAAFDDVAFDELRTKFLLSLAKDVIRFQRLAMSAKTSHLRFAGIGK